MNHVPIGEYRLMFFLKELIACSCNNYSIEIRKHILFEYLQYRKFWNPKRESLKDILTFMKFNSRVFCFLRGHNIKRNIFLSYILVFSLSFLFYLFFVLSK